MKKSEILQAIDSTITSNNKKGISGDSLANILREITNVAGDGNGGGGGGVNAFVFKIPLIAIEAASTIFEEPVIAWNKYIYDLSIDAIAEMVQEELGIENYLETPIHQALLDSIEHNERVISELIEHYRNGQTVSNIKVDATPGLKEMYEMMYDGLDISFGLYEMSFSYGFITANEMPIDNGMQAIYILGNAGQHVTIEDGLSIPPSISISSITNSENLPEEYIEHLSMMNNMVSIGYEIGYYLPVVYINNGNTSEDNVLSNKMFYGSQYNGYFDTQISLIYNENLTKKVGVFGVYIDDENSPYYYSSYFIEGLTVNKLTVNRDGIATVTVVGTLTEESEAVATYGRSVSETATFYIKETGVLTEDEKNHNAESYQMLKNHEAKSVTAIALGDDDSAMFIPCTASVSNTDLITLMIASADADLKPVFTIFTVNASGEITQQQK